MFRMRVYKATIVQYLMEFKQEARSRVERERKIETGTRDGEEQRGRERHRKLAMRAIPHLYSFPYNSYKATSPPCHTYHKRPHMHTNIIFVVMKYDEYRRRKNPRRPITEETKTPSMFLTTKSTKNLLRTSLRCRSTRNDMKFSIWAWKVRRVRNSDI